MSGVKVRIQDKEYLDKEQFLRYQAGILGNFNYRDESSLSLFQKITAFHI